MGGGVRKGRGWCCRSCEGRSAVGGLLGRVPSGLSVYKALCVASHYFYVSLYTETNGSLIALLEQARCILRREH